MLKLKASMAAAVLAGTAFVAAGAGYAISRATLDAQVAVSCPTLETAKAPPVFAHVLPDGPTPPLSAGKQW